MNHRTRRSLRVLVPLVALGLLGAACGSSDDAASTTGASASTTTAAAVTTTSEQSNASTTATTMAPAPSTAASTPTETVPVRIAGILSAGQGIFTTVMVDNGIDKEFGLDVEVVPIASTGQQWLALRDGSADVAAGSVLDLLRQRKAGLDAVSIGAFQTFVNPVLVKSDSSIQSLTDLKGKKVGTPAVTLMDFMILRAAGKKAAGIDVGVDSTPVPAAPNLLNQLLDSGDVDAALQFDSLASGPLAAGTLRSIVRIPDLMQSAGFDSDSFYTLFNVSQSWIDAHPGAAEHLAQAFDKTFQLLQTDDAAWDPVLTEVGITDDAAKQGFIKAQRAILGPPYDSSLVAPTKELIDSLIAVSGPDDVGVTEVDTDAFVFPKE